jgi:predicted ATPase
VLERCPQLTIIATSRESLRVAGEARWQVSSLSTPFAIQLVEARAQLALPEFMVVASNLKTVTQICERRDGMPLAIELAAARVGGDRTISREARFLRSVGSMVPISHRTGPRLCRAALER